MTITPANYHSLAVKRETMSNSQWKQWIECAAATKAEMDGHLVRLDTASEAAVTAAKAQGKIVTVPTEALLVGSYVDRAVTVPTELQSWCDEHAEDVFKAARAKGAPPAKRAAFETADAIIARVKADPMFAKITANCAAQVVFQGRIGDENWLYMADWVDTSKNVLLDFKTAASFEAKWCEEELLWDGEWRRRNVRVEWYDAAGYWRQLAVGRELYFQTHGVYPLCGIVAATKQDPPNLGLWLLDNDLRMEREVGHIKNLTAEVFAWKRGTVPPPACGDCEWCRAQSGFASERDGVSGRMFTV
jgi:hypothetical protein